MSASSQKILEKKGLNQEVVQTRPESEIGVPRMVTRCLKIHETSEGIGSRIRRCIGNRAVRCLPPFVICEQFRMDETGRPPHPARGAQKITYVLNGKVKLEYAPNNKIELGSGDLTSLMVGKGVIRSIKAIPDEESESPPKRKRDTASGIQLFMDVPESFKRIEPSHLNLCHSDITTFSPSSGCQIKILTGSALGQKAQQMLTATPALILDCSVKPGSSVDIPVKLSWNAFAYVIDGSCTVQTEQAEKHYYVEFMRSARIDEESPEPESDNDSSSKPEEEGFVTLAVGNDAKHEARVLFCAAKPLCQPIYRQGPFVDVSMNWIHQAFDDYSSRKNGFESRRWNLMRPQPSRNSPESASAKNTPSWSSSMTGPLSKSNEAECGKNASGSSCDGKSSSNQCKDGSSEAYNPCDDSNCESDDCGKEHKQSSKATFPNAFPPGSVNPASHSTAFNGDEGVEEQQKQKLPGNPTPPKHRKRSRDSDSDEREPGTPGDQPPPPQKK